LNRVKRPFAVTCLVALVLTITATQFLRAWVAFTDFAFYREQLGTILPVFFMLSGLSWGVMGVWLANGLWRGRDWSPRAVRWGLVFYTAFVWLDRLFLQASGPQTVNWPFQLVGTILLLIAVFAALALPQTQLFFGESDERTLKNRRTQ